MKRKIVILVLVLAVAATAIVCVSCAKKEEALEKGMVSYVLEKNAPDVMFGFTVEGGDNVVAHIQHKTATLTLKLEDGSPTFDIQ